MDSLRGLEPRVAVERCAVYSVAATGGSRVLLPDEMKASGTRCYHLFQTAIFSAISLAVFFKFIFYVR